MNTRHLFGFQLTALSAIALLGMISCETAPQRYGSVAGSSSGSDYGRSDKGRYTGPTPSQSATVNQAVLERTNPSNARIEIDLGEQKARLFRVEAGSRELAIETAISTGRSGNQTPTGQFSVLEKLPVKNSSLYGTWVDGQSGALLQGDGDSRSRPSGGNAVFQGSPMPYWLKVTNDGVGMHVGYVASHPVSHGCIRVPNRIQPLIYERVGVGTPITIRG